MCCSIDVPLAAVVIGLILQGRELSSGDASLAKPRPLEAKCQVPTQRDAGKMLDGAQVRSREAWLENCTNQELAKSFEHSRQCSMEWSKSAESNREQATAETGLM